MYKIMGITEKFMEEQRKFVDEFIVDRIELIDLQYLFMSKIIDIEFKFIMSNLLERYEKLKQDGLVTKLKYINISFLRTRILSCEPCYRIDLYDENYVLSDVECCSYWGAGFVFMHLHELYEELKNRFKLQTKVKLYEVDKIIMEKAEIFNKFFLLFLEEILKTHIQEEAFIKIYKEEGVKILVGEFMDNNILLHDFSK